MSTVRRTRLLAAPPEEVWKTVGDVRRMARWWPRLWRVEDVDGDRFTQVSRTDAGREVRADYAVTEREDARLLAIEQELAGTPFEGVLRSASTRIELEAEGEAATRVTITVQRRMRGRGRLGSVLVRRGTGRQLDAALDELDALFGAVPAG